MDRWIKQYQQSGSFLEKDNHSAEENELIALRKENQRLKMEVNILKQAALIMSSSRIVINILYQQCATFYYKAKERKSENDVIQSIVEIFKKES